MTRAKRRSPVTGSRSSTARFSDRFEMYGNGWPGIDRQRGEHREDPLLERLDHELLVVVVELVPARQPDPVGGQRRDDAVEEEALLAQHQALDPVAHLEQLLARGAAVGRGGADPGRHLLLQAGDADLEELVEVLAEDGQELGPLEQRHLLVLGEREHPLVEVEPGELAVEVPRLVVRRSSRRPCVTLVRRPLAMAASVVTWARVRRLVVLGEPEVPVEEDVLPLGVADHPLAVAAELRDRAAGAARGGPAPGPGTRR